MKKAILTIDDVSSKNTPALVDYLAAKDIRAVMFAVGRNVEAFYSEAVYALKAGMIIGNHSYSHPKFSELSLEAGIAEIEKNEAVLDRLYKDANVERTFRPFRFPYGDKGGGNAAAYRAYFKENGFHKLSDDAVTYPWWNEGRENTDTFWTFDFAEYRIRPQSGFTLDDVMARIRDDHPEYGGTLLTGDSAEIILMHAHDETEAMVPRYYEKLIGHALDNGVVFEKPVFR